MDQIAKAIEQEYQLGLTSQQSEEIDRVFRDYMREYHFPLTLPANDILLRFKYFRRALSILTKEQLGIFKKKKILKNAKKKISEKEKRERALISLNQKFKSANLSVYQLETLFEICNTPIKNIAELIDQHSKILNALGPSLTDIQRLHIKKIFSDQMKFYSDRKVDLIKHRYKYLDLNDEQAMKIHISEENEKERLKKNNHLGYYPYMVNSEYENILSTKQFQLYKNQMENRRSQWINPQNKNDTQSERKFKSLKEWINFQVETVLPVKCVIVKQLIEHATESDAVKIKLFKNDYENEIENKIKILLSLNHNNSESELPNQLKLKIIETALLLLNPSPSLIHLNLLQNEFTSLELDKTQQTDLEALNLKIRDYQIQKFEKESKGSYASLITSINRNAEKPKYSDLYSLILLESDPQSNIEKMKKHLQSHNIEF